MDELEARIVELTAEEQLKAIRPELDGREVMEHLGIAPGPLVGTAMEFLLELRLEEGLLGRDEVLRRLDAWWATQSVSPSTAVRVGRTTYSSVISTVLSTGCGQLPAACEVGRRQRATFAAMSEPTSTRFDLTGKVALVTGGSRGLGREMVLAFAEAGADVVIASRKLDACQALARQVEADFGRRRFPSPATSATGTQVGALADAAYERFGRVDVLVNNAGMSPLYDSLDAVSEDLYDKVFGVNLKGPFRLSAIVGSRMAAGDGGSIINVSSVASMRPSPRELPYAAAKAGLNVITEGMARAFGPKVRVNCIVAGPFLTDISTAWDMPAFERNAKQAIALQRGGRPDEVVGAALYFASDASSFTTGALLRIDGGAA